jgi:hypothetical protein
MLAMAEDMQDLLIDAIMQSDLAAIARLIERGASPDRLSECDMTPLMFAVEHELVDSIEALVRAGANLNAQNSRGLSPIHWAVDIAIDGTLQTKGKLGSEPTQIVEFLLEHGAKVDLRDRLGETPLDATRRYGSERVVRILERAARQNEGGDVALDQNHNIDIDPSECLKADIQWELTGDWEVKYTAEFKGTRLTICDAGEEGDLLGYSYLLTIPGIGTFELIEWPDQWRKPANNWKLILVRTRTMAVNVKRMLFPRTKS